MLRFLMSHARKNPVRMIHRKWIYTEKHSTERGSSQKMRMASKCDEVSFYGLGSFIEKSVCRSRSNS